MKKSDKENLLFEAMSEINDEWIEQAVEYKHTKKIISFPFLKYVNIAAALIICIISVLVFVNLEPVNELDIINKDNNSTESPIVTDELVSSDSTDKPVYTPDSTYCPQNPIRTREPLFKTEVPLVEPDLNTKEPNIGPVQQTTSPTGDSILRTPRPEKPVVMTPLPTKMPENNPTRPTKTPGIITSEPTKVPVNITPAPTFRPSESEYPNLVAPTATPIPPELQLPSGEPDRPVVTSGPTCIPAPSTGEPIDSPTLEPDKEHPGAQPSYDATASPTCTPSPAPTEDLMSSEAEMNVTSDNELYILNGPLFLEKYLVKKG